MDAIKSLVKQPYWVVALILGSILVSFPCVSFNNWNWTTHGPTSLWPVTIGLLILVVSAAAFVMQLYLSQPSSAGDPNGLDLNRVKEVDGVSSVVVNECEICVVNGRIETFARDPHVVVALPCNEYFDDLCINDSRSALGAYANRVFEGQLKEFEKVVLEECPKRLRNGSPRPKTVDVEAISFGVGKCILLEKPLGRAVSNALVSTTKQRATEGLFGRVSYLFDGIAALFERLADARKSEVVIPVLGAGHGGISAPMAFVGLLLAIAETARYGRGGRRPKKVTIVNFQISPDSEPQVSRAIVQRALALIASSS